LCPGQRVQNNSQDQRSLVDSDIEFSTSDLIDKFVKKSYQIKKICKFQDL
jgi:hypothetical protein